MKITGYSRYAAVCVVVLAATTSLVSGALAQDLVPVTMPSPEPELLTEQQSDRPRESAPEQQRVSASETVSENTREFLSDRARTGSLVGTIIAGAVVPNPLAPLLGSVVGFIIGKRSSYTDEEGTSGDRTLANRGFVPEVGESVPSIAGLANAEGSSSATPNPFARMSSESDAGNQLAFSEARSNSVPATATANDLPVVMPGPSFGDAAAEPTIAMALPGKEIVAAGDSENTLIPEDAVASALPRRELVREPMANDGVFASATRRQGSGLPDALAGQTASEISASNETGVRVVVPVEVPELIDSGDARVTNRPEQMVKTTYDHAGVEAIKRLRQQLAESCSRGQHEKPTTTRCYYFAQ